MPTATSSSRGNTRRNEPTGLVGYCTAAIACRLADDSGLLLLRKIVPHFEWPICDAWRGLAFCARRRAQGGATATTEPVSVRAHLDGKPVVVTFNPRNRQLAAKSARRNIWTAWALVSGAVAARAGRASCDDDNDSDPPRYPHLDCLVSPRRCEPEAGSSLGGYCRVGEVEDVHVRWREASCDTRGFGRRV